MKSFPGRKEAARQPLRGIVEMIVLQAMEDIWLPYGKRESLEFFSGGGFSDCADMLGMGPSERVKVLEFVHEACMCTVRMPKPNPSSFKIAYTFSPERHRFRN